MPRSLLRSIRNCVVVFAAMFVAATASAVDGWWIWDRPADQGSDDAPRFIRCVFELAEKPETALLKATADNAYEAFVNGKRVGGDGAWQSLDEFDVTKLLVVGKNVLAIEARNQGGLAAAFARLEVKLPGNKRVFFGTDAKSRVSIVSADGWKDTGFDEAQWPLATIIGNATIGPWNIAGPQPTATGAKDGSETNTLDPNIKERLSAQEQLKHFVVPQDFSVELVATDPQVINPVTIALDERGRIYVSESHTYRYGPDGSPIKPYRNPIIRLEPKNDGTMERVLVADGFDDPVMGIAIRDGKMWATANNFLFQFDLPETGPATNRKILVEDKNKAWNPFGMFVLEFGPDGLLYMSVGDHGTRLEGPTNKLNARGSSGVIVRMKPDGSDMEQLTHGFRVPYSFEFDPFGQLWLLSNGEGNPNRFARIIDGVDYHCFTRGVDYKWLAGTQPLSPPAFELPGGAHTQLLRYYGAAYPADYQGSLFLDNWGRHGFSGGNRAVFRYVPDEKNDIALKESFVSCGDPHFRVSHIALDPDGNMLLADWYGRDDESDLTGRIWRVRYNGKDKALARAKRDTSSVAKLGEQAATAKDSVVAAEALWALVRMGTPESQAAIAMGVKHADWRVRKLAMSLLRHHKVPSVSSVAASLQNDPNLSVRIEAARSLDSPDAIRTAMFEILKAGAADDAHLRYECAWHIAKNADAATLDALLASEDSYLQLAGQIAVDIACYENFATKPVALEALRKKLESAPAEEIGPLLTLARYHSDASLVPAMVKIASRTDLPVATVGQALLILKSKSDVSPEVIAVAGKRLLEAAASGQVSIESQSDWLLLFDLIELEGPTPFALNRLVGQLDQGDQRVRDRAHGVARGFGTKAAGLAPKLWEIALKHDIGLDHRFDALLTLPKVEATPNLANWEKLLSDQQPVIRREAVRSFRLFVADPTAKDILRKHAAELIKSDDSVKGELAIVLTQLGVSPADLVDLALPEPISDKSVLTEQTLDATSKLSGDDARWSANAGRNVFDRVGCVKCHTTIEANSLKAPSLKGIGQAQKPPYLIESVLFPSNILKTGFETKSIQTTDGRVLVGLVKEDGDKLRVLNATEEVTIPKADIEERVVQKLSIMPEGQEKLISQREFVDLIEYLMSLK